MTSGTELKVCAEDGCETILSRYGKTKWCAAHEGRHAPKYTGPGFAAPVRRSVLAPETVNETANLVALGPAPAVRNVEDERGACSRCGRMSWFLWEPDDHCADCERGS